MAIQLFSVASVSISLVKCGKFTKCSLLVIRYFLKCSVHAKQIWSLLLLEKIYALVACSQMLAKTIKAHPIPLALNFNEIDISISSDTVLELGQWVSEKEPGYVIHFCLSLVAYDYLFPHCKLLLTNLSSHINKFAYQKQPQLSGNHHETSKSYWKIDPDQNQGGSVKYGVLV